jgi:hypothetical protein
MCVLLLVLSGLVVIVVDLVFLYRGYLSYCCGYLMCIVVFHLGRSCTVSVLICTVVVLYCFVTRVRACVCVCARVCVRACAFVICILYSD